MKVPKSFYSATDIWTPTETESDSYPGHAMCIIGYNNNLYRGSFELMNSRGQNWRNKGFCHIKYKDFTKFVKYAYEISNPRQNNNKTNFKAIYV